MTDPAGTPATYEQLLDDAWQAHRDACHHAGIDPDVDLIETRLAGASAAAAAAVRILHAAGHTPARTIHNATATDTGPDLADYTAWQLRATPAVFPLIVEAGVPKVCGRIAVLGLPRPLVERMARHEDRDVRAAIAGVSPNLGEFADVLAADPSPMVRRQLAGNRTAPRETLERMLVREWDRSVVAAIAGNLSARGG